MTRSLAALVIAAMLASTVPMSADTTAAAQSRGFRPLWTAVGAGAGFGFGVWIGLTKFDDAFNSDRKVWTTAIVSAAIGGVLGLLVDRHQARTSNPSPTPSGGSDPAASRSWREAIYGSPTSAATLSPPPVRDLIHR